MFSERNKNGDSLSPADQYYKKCPLQKCFIWRQLYVYVYIIYTSCTHVERDLSKHYIYICIYFVCMYVCVCIHKERDTETNMQREYIHIYVKNY